MKWMIVGCGVLLGAAVASADVTEFKRSGRYELYISPQAHRIYVLDTQTGRLFQVVNYKEINKEILEEIPYVFGSNRLCTPAEYEISKERCFTKNYEHIRTLLDLKRVPKELAPLPPPPPPEKAP